jgi:DNA-binding NarL/FixJ family response regulator
MPEMGGLEFLKEVRHRKPFPAILILSMHSDIEFITEAIASGARGYVSKGDTDKEELREAIRAVHNGEEYYGKSIRHMMQQQFIAGYKPAEPDESKKGFEKLTRREKEILKMVMEGFSNQEIANSTFVSIRTVETHKNNIMTKLNLKNTVELVKYAIKNQFFDL